MIVMTPEVLKGPATPPVITLHDVTVHAVTERETIERVLLRTSWNRKQAAKLLNVSYKTLLQKIRECGLEAQ